MDNRKFGKLIKKSLLDHNLLVKAMKLSCKEQAKIMEDTMPCGGKKRKRK